MISQPVFKSPATQNLGSKVRIGRFEYYTVHGISASLECPPAHLVNVFRKSGFPGRKIGLVYLVPSDLPQNFHDELGKSYATRRNRKKPLDEIISFSLDRERRRDNRKRLRNSQPDSYIINGGKDPKRPVVLDPTYVDDVPYFTLTQISRIVGIQLRVLQKNVYAPGCSLIPDGVHGLVSDEQFHTWISSDSFSPQHRRRKVV